MIEDEIGRAMSRLGLLDLAPNGLSGEVLAAQAAARFAAPGSGPLWERIDAVAVRDAEAWQWLADLPMPAPWWLWLEGGRGGVWGFGSGDALVALLAETPGFEFYLSDVAMTWLLAFNHHDYLIGCGAAVEWLTSRKRR